MTVQAVTVDLLDAAGSTVQAGLRYDPSDTSYSEELNDAGAASVVLPSTVPGASSVDAGTLLRFRVDGTTDYTARVEPPLERTVAATDNAKREVRIKARDWLAEWDDVLVQPPMGRSATPAADQVVYDWRHPIVPLGGSTPTYLGSLFGGDLDPLGDPASASPTSKAGWPPTGWVDTFSGWISGAAVDGNQSHPVDAVFYATLTLTVSAGLLSGQWAADDTGDLAVGGVMLDRCEEWWTGRNWGLDTVAAGTVTIRLRVANAVVPGNPSNLGNPTTFALTAYQASGSNQFRKMATLIARTGLNVSSGDPTQGGGWSTRWSPESPPGITVGRAIRHQKELAGMSGWTLGFTDTTDSNGATWPVRDDITARTSDTLLAWFRQLAARGMCDFWASPSTRTLHASLPGQRGDFHTGPGSPPTFTGSHLGQVDIARRW